MVLFMFNEERYDCKYAQSCTQNGLPYSIPKNMDEKLFYKLLNKMLYICKKSKITVKQSQILFETCKQYVADSTIIDKILV